MTYRDEAVAYWSERAARQGPTYVAKGGRPKSFEKQRDAIVPFLAHLRPGRVLDFGCGSGRFRSALETKGEYVGVDLVPGNSTVAWDAETLPTGFGSAFACMVLQHITDEAEYRHWAREMGGSLAEGGRLLVVDHGPLEDPEPHMRPRGAEVLHEAGGFAGHRIVGEYDGHWVGVFWGRAP